MRAAFILGWGALVLLALPAPKPAAGAAAAADTDTDADVYVTAGPCVGRHRPLRRYPVPARQYPVDASATYLDMEYCTLTQFKEGYVKGLPNLTDISLVYNDIEYISLAFFRFVPTLKRLSLGGNKLRHLSVFPEGSCPNLMFLDLRQNKLTAISDAATFAACSELVFINLIDDDIKYIHPHAFNSLPKLKWLDLSHNRLTFLPDHMFAESLTPLHLYVSDNKLTRLPKDFVARMKEDRVGFKEFIFNENPWHCACLLELLADLKRSGVDHFISSEESLGQKPQCVFFGPSPCDGRCGSGLLGPPRAA